MKVNKMNKLLVALGLAATVALVGCNKEKAPETGATTGEHLENQAGEDIKDATHNAAENTAVAVDNAAAATENAAHNTAVAVDNAADTTVDATKDATANAAAAVEEGAANVKEKAQQ